MTATIVIVVIVGIAAAAAMAVLFRRRELQRRFGPEYDRAVARQDSRLRAEAELTARQRRVRKLDIKPLSAEARLRYAADWLAIQEHFVDSPQAAVGAAYQLLTSVMTERGYPLDDDEQVLADLSVDHAPTVGHFRSAREITAHVTGAPPDAVTEELRQAMIHYRALAADLLGEPRSRLSTAAPERVPPGPGAANGSPASSTVLANGASDRDGLAADTGAPVTLDESANQQPTENPRR